MPRRSSSPSFYEKKIVTMPIRIKEQGTPPAIIPQRPSFLQTMKEGVALGIGSSIGHRVVGAFMGPLGASAHREPIIPPIKEHVPRLMNREYEQCMEEYDDKAVCEKYIK